MEEVLEHLPFLQKLWDKGIDISASVITSVIIAALAWVAWKLKFRHVLEEEAQKLRQSHRLTQDLEAPAKRKAAEERYARLSKQREAHAESVQVCTDATEIIAAWANYERWLQDENLQYSPKNIDFMRAMANEREAMRANAHTRRFADTLPDRIRLTDLE